MAERSHSVIIDRGRYAILGVKINAINYAGAVKRIMQAAADGRPYRVTALAVHGVMTGVQDASHRHRLNAMDLVLPDGQPVRWAVKLLYRVGLPDRVYGPTLMLKLCEEAAEAGLPIYIYGGTPQMIDQLAQCLQGRFPKLNIAGCSPSRFRQVSIEEQVQINQTIRQSEARLVFVGLGCPRQEVWAYENAADLSMPVVAVGAAFAFHAGLLSQAPQWMQQSGLEWFYRLMKEPRRLWKRYLFLNPAYLGLLLLQAFGIYTIETQCKRPSMDLRYG